jgi:hypothetical protein
MSAYSVAINTVWACWIIFLAVWLMAAISTKRSVYHESRAQRLRYSILLLTAYFLLTRGHRLPYPLSARVIPHMEVIAWAGVVLCVASLSFCIWARVTLGRNWSGAVTLKEGHELIERGPVSAGAPSNLYRIDCDVPRHCDGSGIRGRNCRPGARVRQFLDKTPRRRKGHAQAVSRSICGLSTTREAHHSIRPLAIAILAGASFKSVAISANWAIAAFILGF